MNVKDFLIGRRPPPDPEIEADKERHEKRLRSVNQLLLDSNRAIAEIQQAERAARRR